MTAALCLEPARSAGPPFRYPVIPLSRYPVTLLTSEQLTVLLVGAIGFDGGKGLWDACRACSSRSLNRWAKQRNCEHAACARGLTRSATFVPGSLRLGNERHLAGWSRREPGTAGRDASGWRAAHSPFFVAAREISRTAMHVEFCSDRPFGRGFDSRRLHLLIRGLRPRTPSR